MRWTLTAAETDAQSRMPVTLMVARAIEVATRAADALGVGYSTLHEHRMGWVLARIAVEILRYPRINEQYSLTTWIEGYNRYFCDRCFEMVDVSGQVCARIRSVWVAIDIDNRTMADLRKIETSRFPISKKECPLSKCTPPQILPDEPVKMSSYTFKYRDIDFNRHVNTIKYLDVVLNQYSMEFFDHHVIRGLEASFEHECYYGDTVDVKTGAGSDHRQVSEIMTKQHRAVSVALKF